MGVKWVEVGIPVLKENNRHERNVKFSPSVDAGVLKCGQKVADYMNPNPYVEVHRLFRKGKGPGIRGQQGTCGPTMPEGPFMPDMGDCVVLTKPRPVRANKRGRY